MLEVKYQHYRVPKNIYPDRFPLPKSGKPHPERVIRYFRGDGFKNLGGTPHEKGGLTMCKVYLDGDEVARGVAWCSFSDNFCYETGRRIALGRARKKLERKAGRSLDGSLPKEA